MRGTIGGDATFHEDEEIEVGETGESADTLVQKTTSKPKPQTDRSHYEQGCYLPTVEVTPTEA